MKCGETAYLEKLSLQQIQLSPMELQGYSGPSGAAAFMELIETLTSTVFCFRTTLGAKKQQEMNILGELVL